MMKAWREWKIVIMVDNITRIYIINTGLILVLLLLLLLFEKQRRTHEDDGVNFRFNNNT